MSTHAPEKKWMPPQRFSNYVLEREIDGGGMGIVYKGFTAEQRKVVAIKFLLESSQYKRFRRELNTGQRIIHPNFVRYYDTGEIDGHFYIVMDFVDGLPLKRYMEQVNLTPDKRLELFYKIVSAMSYAHKCGVIHRDLKPANILINRQAEPIILDFGLAKYLQVPDEDVTALTMEGQIIGTPGYMSPEQARGEIENQDERTDIFALGIILFEMLTARNPFEGANFLEVCYNIAHRAPADIEQVLPGIPPKLSYICNKALAREKIDRYQTAHDFAEDVKGYLAWRHRSKECPTMDTQNLRVEDLAAISSQSAGNIATQIHTPEMVRPSKTPHPPTPSSPQYGDTGRRVCSSCGAMNSASQETCRNCKAVLHTPTPKVISPNVPSNEVANGFAKANPSAFLKPKPPALKPSTAKVIATPPPGQIIQEPMSYQWVLYIFWILLGMVVFPVTMLPVFKGCPTSVYAWDIVAGAIASFFLIYSQHAILAGIIFELIAIVSWVGKWLSASVSVEFFSQKMGLFIIALILVFLLGINLGLISKKIIPQKKLS